MAGSYDFLLKLCVSDIEELNHIKNTYLTNAIGIKTLKSEIILKTVKSTTDCLYKKTRIIYTSFFITIQQTSACSNITFCKTLIPASISFQSVNSRGL